LCCCKNENTFSHWAAQVGALQKLSVSKQALFERTSESAVAFARMLLEHLIKRQVRFRKSNELFQVFNRVILQDSTTLKLPDSLSAFFPGNICRGVQKAVARIQCVVNLKTFQFLDFRISGFTRNDQSASKDIIRLIGKGDLVIRDLGFFVVASLRQIMRKDAFFLTRLRYGMQLYTCQANPLHWKQLCKTGKIVDQMVLLGKEKLPVRLVMIPLPAKQIAERVRKARTDRDKRVNHTREFYQWLRYAVFITNVDSQVWSPKQVAAVYRIRWQIEIIFKSWKSSFNLQKILHDGCTNETRVRLNIYLVLMFICLFMQKIYMRYKDHIERQCGASISLIKLSKYVVQNLLMLLTFNTRKLKEEIARHCCYDKRSDRLNMADLIKFFKS
jgi:Transposase DDE domain